MSQLALTKNYADLEVLFESDLDGMWDELEAKVNGNIDADNVQSGWANLAQLTISDNVALYFGATSTAYISYNGTTDQWTFGNTSAAKDVIFYVNNTEVARIDGDQNNLVVQKDVYFANRSTDFSLFRIIGGYKKPVLIYSSASEIIVESNIETANSTLIVFPCGPIAVTENVAAAHKFRALRTDATANGYISTHTGAADSGLRVGLSLAANTWYFVYAVRTQYGDDAGNSFILVLDDTDPSSSNEATLNTRYGSSQWVYLGSVRRGYGDYSTTTLIPFQMDRQGWTYFTDNASTSGVSAAGVQVFSDTSYNTTYTNLFTVAEGNSGDNIPAHFAQLQLQHIVTDTDGVYRATTRLQNSGGFTLWQGPAFYSDADRKDGYCPRIINYVGLSIQSSWQNTSDSTQYITITGFQDNFV